MEGTTAFLHTGDHPLEINVQLAHEFLCLKALR